MDLGTNYLGIHLPHPLVVGSGPLGDDLDTVKSLEDAGAAAIVLRSLYEEEITGEQIENFLHSESYDDSSAEAGSYFPSPDSALGPEEYIEHLQRVKRAVRIPVIASLNGTTPGKWLSYARLLEQGGADALELSIYHAASDPTTSAADVEGLALDIVRQVKQGIRIPIAVKLTPLLTAFAHFALQLDAAGVDGLVLFTRFHDVDIDVEALEIVRSVKPSGFSDLQLRLRGTAALAGRVRASLAITGGVHTALDVIKATMVGADVTQLVSALILNGPGHLRTVRKELETWLEKNEWNSLREMRGNMSLQRMPNPSLYERENFRTMLRSSTLS